MGGDLHWTVKAFWVVVVLVAVAVVWYARRRNARKKQGSE
jgi:heme/copper-type cytochrome/quinol oxidase subunit 2